MVIKSVYIKNILIKVGCKWRIPTVSFAEQNGRDA